MINGFFSGSLWTNDNLVIELLSTKSISKCSYILLDNKMLTSNYQAPILKRSKICEACHWWGSSYVSSRAIAILKFKCCILGWISKHCTVTFPFYLQNCIRAFLNHFRLQLGWLFDRSNVNQCTWWNWVASNLRIQHWTAQ